MDVETCVRSATEQAASWHLPLHACSTSCAQLHQSQRIIQSQYRCTNLLGRCWACNKWLLDLRMIKCCLVAYQCRSKTSVAHSLCQGAVCSDSWRHKIWHDQKHSAAQCAGRSQRVPPTKYKRRSTVKCFRCGICTGGSG